MLWVNRSLRDHPFTSLKTHPEDFLISTYKLFTVLPFSFTTADLFPTEFPATVVVERWPSYFEDSSLIWSFMIQFRMKGPVKVGEYKTMLYR